MYSKTTTIFGKMSSNLFEAVFMNIMVDVITGSMRERIRQTDEMIIPDWLFISNQERNNEQRLHELAETMHREMENASERLFRDLLSVNHEDNNNEVLNDSLIPEWLFQEEPQQRLISQATSRNSHIGSANYVTINDYTSLYPSTFIPFFRSRFVSEPFKQLKTIEKAIDKSKNTECPITYDEIKIGDAYMTCEECKYNFSEVAIMTHLNEKKSCPMCRCDWKDVCKYINRHEIHVTKKNINILKNFDMINYYDAINNACTKGFKINCNILGKVDCDK